MNKSWKYFFLLLWNGNYTEVFVRVAIKNVSLQTNDAGGKDFKNICFASPIKRNWMS